MRAAVSLALFSLAASTDARAAVDVRQEGERVSVRAEAAPLSEVLDRLARQLGMKVIYEGAPPRALVSAALENRTPAQAVFGVLEGTGVDYLARMDRTATRVDRLIVSSSGGAASAGTSPRPATPVLGGATPPPDEEASDEEEEQPEEPPQPRVHPRQGGGDNADQERPRPGAGPALGRPPNGVPGAPGFPGVPGILNPGGAPQPSYPVSPFAPVPPPPTTLPAPPPPAAAQDDGSEEE